LSRENEGQAEFSPLIAGHRKKEEKKSARKVPLGRVKEKRRRKREGEEKEGRFPLSLSSSKGKIKALLGGERAARRKGKQTCETQISSWIRTGRRDSIWAGRSLF